MQIFVKECSTADKVLKRFFSDLMVDFPPKLTVCSFKL